MNLKNLSCFLLISVITFAIAGAEDSNFKNKQEKISYCIGLDIGQNFKSGDWDLDIDAVMEGIQHAFNDKEWKLEKDEMRRILNDFRKQRQQEQMKLNKERAEKRITEGTAFLEKNAKKEGVTVLPSGLQYEIMTKGDGKSPQKTDMVEVNYRGTFINGDEFDSSYKRGKPVNFGVNKVIPGWTEALQLMKENSKWRLFIPSNLAYGERGAGQAIGPNETLIFEVELLKVNPETK